jgi:hypothetical protein
VYCSIDRVDLAARVGGRPVAIQTDLARDPAHLERARGRLREP